MKKLFIIIQLLLLVEYYSLAGCFESNPIEKIKIVTDRDIYIPGEKVWFNAFISNENINYLSTTIYTELISPNNFSVDRKKLHILDGIARGEFSIPDTLSTGYYTFLAYTNYTKSNSLKSFAKKTVFIYNPEKRKLSNATNNLELPISMENNLLISRLKNRIYYKCNENIIVKLIENNLDTIKPLLNKQYGYFEFTPDAEKHYKILTETQGQIKTIKLPIAMQSGLISNITEINSNQLKLRIQSSETVRAHNPFVFVSINNEDTPEKIALNKELLYHPIALNNFKEGINTIRIKNANDEIMWERNVDLDKTTKASIEITDIKNNYYNRSKVKFAISKQESCEFTYANLAISVRKVEANYSSNSELDDLFIRNINELFKSEIKNPSENTYWENYGPVISGKLIDNSKRPLSDVKIILAYVNSVTSIQVDKTDSVGDFKFIVYSNNNINDLVITPETDEDATILIKNNYLDNYYQYKSNYTNLNDTLFQQYLDELYINSRMNKVYQLNKRHNDSLVKYNNHINWRKNNFYSKPDKIIRFEQYVLLDSMQEYFHEFFPSITINNRKGERSFKIVNESKEVLMNQPAIFIDGVLYHDSEILFALNPAQCDRIEVVKSDYLIYDKVYGGLICLYTKGHDLKDVTIPKNSTRIIYKLYDETFSFKQIKHKKNIPDFRNTLYWEGNINLKTNDPYSVEFFTGDDKSRYEVFIYGFTNDGRLINESRIFEVK